MRPGAEKETGRDRAHTGLFQERRPETAHTLLDLALEDLGLAACNQDATSHEAKSKHDRLLLLGGRGA